MISPTDAHAEPEARRVPVPAAPIDLIRTYWTEIWNERHTQRIRDVCQDPIVRHDPGCIYALDHDQQIARVQQTAHAVLPLFTHEVLLADDRFVCSVWNMFSRAPGQHHDICGIEVFKATDGRLSDCWNSPYLTGFWGRLDGDPDPLRPRSQAVIHHGCAAGAATDAGDLMRRFLVGLAQGDAEALTSLVASDFIRYRPGGHDRLAPVDLLADPRADRAEAAVVTFDVLLANHDYVCGVWNLDRGDGHGPPLCGIDVMRHGGGRLVEWWSAPVREGVWGRDGDGDVSSALPEPTLLASSGAIDERWLQAVFHHVGVALPRIARVDARPIGCGNPGDTVRVTIGYNTPAADAPSSVNCTFGANLPPVETAALSPTHTEAGAYAFFGPTPPMRVPRVYRAGCSADGLTVNLVLEDLTVVCAPGDEVAGCTIADAGAVVHELAMMHARYWNAPELKSLSWMAANRAGNASHADDYAAGLAVFETRCADMLDQEDLAVIRDLVPLIAAWQTRGSEPFTLVHSAPWLGNVMFDRRRQRPLAYLVNWQRANLGSASRDLACFLTGSLAVEDRRACEDALIATHAGLIAGIDPAFTIAVARDRYRLETMSALFTTVTAASAMPDTPHNRDLLAAVARRNAAAVRDWAALRAIAQTV